MAQFRNFLILFLCFSLVFSCLFGQSKERDTLKIWPQYVDQETLSKHIFPLLSRTAKIQYLPQENLILITDETEILAQVKVLFDLLNQPAQEVEVHLKVVETKTPIAPTPTSWQMLETKLKENPPLFQSEIFLNTNSGELTAINSSFSQERSLFYSFLPKVHRAQMITLKSNLKMSKKGAEGEEQTFHYENTLNFKAKELRLLASVPKTFHQSSFVDSHLAIFVQCSLVPRFYPVTESSLGNANSGKTSSLAKKKASNAGEIKLEGIIFIENNPKKSWAFLKIDNITQQVTTGMRFKGVKILKIESNQILLERNGRQIKLLLE